MKKLLITIFAALAVISSASAAEASDRKYEINGRTITATTTTTTSRKAAQPATPTGYNYKTKDGQLLPVYKTATGRYFVERVSRKSGKTYKQYLKGLQLPQGDAKGGKR